MNRRTKLHHEHVFTFTDEELAPYGPECTRQEWMAALARRSLEEDGYGTRGMYFFGGKNKLKVITR